MTRSRMMATRAVLGFCVGAVLGWAASTTARGAENTGTIGRAPQVAAGDGVGTPVMPACALGRLCTGTDGCATDCDPDTSLISGCARCLKGVYAGCSQGECQTAMVFSVAGVDEALCPSQLMTPCPTVGEMCTIGHTAHRCQCSAVGGEQHPKWICK